MPRYKLVNGERIQFTAEEEAARDAEEAAWTAGAFDCIADAIDTEELEVFHYHKVVLSRRSCHLYLEADNHYTYTYK